MESAWLLGSEWFLSNGVSRERKSELFEASPEETVLFGLSILVGGVMGRGAEAGVFFTMHTMLTEILEVEMESEMKQKQRRTAIKNRVEGNMGDLLALESVVEGLALDAMLSEQVGENLIDERVE